MAPRAHERVPSAPPAPRESVLQTKGHHESWLQCTPDRGVRSNQPKGTPQPSALARSPSRTRGECEAGLFI
eukprot:4770646-Pyramimonas_sp.AAC.1